MYEKFVDIPYSTQPISVFPYIMKKNTSCTVCICKYVSFMKFQCIL